MYTYFMQKMSQPVEAYNCQSILILIIVNLCLFINKGLEFLGSFILNGRFKLSNKTGKKIVQSILNYSYIKKN